MLSLSPSLDDGVVQEHLDLIVAPCRAVNLCYSAIRRLHQRFRVYAATCPEPLPARGLVITPEMRRQSELFLPVAEIAAAFNRLYRDSLIHSPIIESTPFHNALSWADVFVTLPQCFQFSANPARLLEELSIRPGLLTEFLCASFLPQRFYGGFRRYPLQREYVGSWLGRRNGKNLRCLDAACGTGEDSYGLALLLLEHGYQPADFEIEGWTIEPLEVWAAAHVRFPHNREREAAYRREAASVFTRKASDRIRFQAVDLRGVPAYGKPAAFDLILCNGLLGGPIIHTYEDMNSVVQTLAHLLVPGGMLLAADHFHGGWKQRCPQQKLRALCDRYGLQTAEVEEGISALKPDQ